MPLKVFLSHASVDKPVVEDVKRHLEEGGDIECWLDKFEIGFGQNIVSRINDGLTKSDFLLFFLSPTALKSKWVEEEWTAAYYSQVNSGDTRLVPVLIGDAQPPAILENKKYCDLRTNQLEGMRQLKTHLLRTTPRPAPGGHSGASLPNFIGREAEITELKERLSQPGSVVPIIGMPGLGKTWLAREFIRRHGDLFEAVYQLDCGQRDLAALAGELATQLGLRLDGEADQVAKELRRYVSAKRCLLFLDNVDDDQPGALVPEGRAAVMITSRNQAGQFWADYPELRPPLFGDEEALELFHRRLGSVDEAPAKQLFRRLEHLPMAIAVSAGLIKGDVRYTVESLLTALPPLEALSFGKNNVGRLLGNAIGALEEMPRQLLVSMAACAPGGVHLGFAAEVAGLSEANSLNALQDLYSRSLVVELDRATHRYRLHALIRDAACPTAEVRHQHALRTLEHLRTAEEDPVRAAEFIEEAERATSVLANQPEPVKATIANLAGNLAQRLGRMAEAHEFYLRVQAAATKATRQDWLAVGLGNQALILQAWGKLEGAMALHEQEEAICRGLGDRAGLGRSYGNKARILRSRGKPEEAMALNKQQEAIYQDLGDRAGLQAAYGSQALILREWGKPAEAMALHKREEAICRELGDRPGLARSYSNQALILQEWGKLAEAMALNKQQDAIYQELGDRAGLQVSYRNQALILQEWGELEEAMVLHKQEEAICQELGDRAGLQASYGNQAAILQKRGKLKEAMELRKREEAIGQELGDRAGLARSFGNQALILQEWGKLEEAMAFLRKKEAICLELGGRASLARCYWSWGLVAKEQNDSTTHREKLGLALAIFTELGMVRECKAIIEEMNPLERRVTN